jgi:N-acetylmuramoyl-L-alanine amidase
LKIIYLDPGHGGHDAGAVGNELKEKDLNLNICKKIEAILKNYDCKIIMSRNTDEFLTLDERTDKANKEKADLLLSVHINAATIATAKGFETYIHPKAKAATIAFQNVLHDEIIKSIGSSINNRGKKQANYHMVRESNMSAVLTENLFISNKSDAAHLADDQFLQKVAEGHALGIVNFLGLQEHEKKPPSDEDEDEDQTLYIVQVGAFFKKDNAENLKQDLLKLGYNPIIKRQ